MINFRKYGSPPYLVVLVHGGPGAGGEMAPVAQELSKDFGVLEPIQTEFSIKGQLDELKTVVKNNCEFPFTLVGYSWVAWLCCLFTASNPDIVKKLILLSSGPFEEKYAKNILNTRLNRLSKKESTEVLSIVQVLNYQTAKEKSSVFERFGDLFSKADAYDPIRNNQKSGIEFRYDIFQTVWQEAVELRKKGDLLKIAAKIICPVVAFHGDYDPHPAEGVQIPLSAILNDFRFILLKKCGHKPWIEKQVKEIFYNLLKNEL